MDKKTADSEGYSKVKLFQPRSLDLNYEDKDVEMTISMLRATLESTADGIILVNKDGLIECLNDTVKRMWNIPESLEEGKDDNLLLGCILEQVEQPENFIEKVGEVYNRPDEESHDIIALKDGRIFERYSRPHRVGGKSVGRVWSFRDITKNVMAREDLERSLKTLRKAMGGVIQAMAITVEKRDPYTAGHQRRVAELARSIAREMGLSDERTIGIHLAGGIHDIGKICVPSDILSKPGVLNHNEFAIIKDHSTVGYDILKEIEFPWPIAEIVYQHHEKMNGSGYPRGLKGDEILLEARIVSLSDVVEAMASHRPYRPTLGIDKALEEISKFKGIYFDSDVVDACMKVLMDQGFKLE
ncbi:HD domain-containing phosphohydrolase [Thermodesulfobacteriota bacterium]